MLKAAPEMNINEIKEQLQGKKIEVKEFIKLRGKNSTSYSYLITTTKETNIGEVKKIRDIGNMMVKWETFQKKRNYAQCYRCQRFGHGASNCRLQPRCVKCAGPHLTTI